MRRFAAILLGVVLGAVPALAQAPPAPAPPAPAPPVNAPAAKAPEYDPKAEVTIKGVVDDFHEAKVRTDHPGLHLILKTETETVEVHACPVSFMSELEFVIEKGDTLTYKWKRRKMQHGKRG